MCPCHCASSHTMCPCHCECLTHTVCPCHSDCECLTHTVCPVVWASHSVYLQIGLNQVCLFQAARELLLETAVVPQPPPPPATTLSTSQAKAIQMALKLCEKLVEIGAPGAVDLLIKLSDPDFSAFQEPNGLVDAGRLMDQIRLAALAHGLRKEAIELVLAWRLGFPEPSPKVIFFPRLGTPSVVPGSKTQREVVQRIAMRGRAQRSDYLVRRPTTNHRRTIDSPRKAMNSPPVRPVPKNNHNYQRGLCGCTTRPDFQSMSQTMPQPTRPTTCYRQTRPLPSLNMPKLRHNKLRHNQLALTPRPPTTQQHRRHQIHLHTARMLPCSQMAPSNMRATTPRYTQEYPVVMGGFADVDCIFKNCRQPTLGSIDFSPFPQRLFI